LTGSPFTSSAEFRYLITVKPLILALESIKLFWTP